MTEPTLYEQKHDDLSYAIHGTRQEPVISIEEIAKIIVERFKIEEVVSLIDSLEEKIINERR